MATLSRNLLLAGLIFTATLTAGCSLMSIPYFFLPGMDPKTDPKCPLASKDKDKTVKVLILSQSSLDTRPEFLRVDRDLARMLSQSMEEGFKRNKEKVVMVRNSLVESFKDEHPNWKVMGAVEIGKQFKADYVVELSVNQITLYEPEATTPSFAPLRHFARRVRHHRIGRGPCVTNTSPSIEGRGHRCQQQSPGSGRKSCRSWHVSFLVLHVPLVEDDYTSVIIAM